MKQFIVKVRVTNMPKVLIIDDEPNLVDMLTTLLGMSGYEAVSALNGQDGLVLSQVESPDVLILDLMLPDIQGYDVCKTVRSVPQTAALPVLILSARTAQADKDRALAAGANSYMTKPVRMAELLKELKRLLAAASLPPATPTVSSTIQVSTTLSASSSIPPAQPPTLPTLPPLPPIPPPGPSDPPTLPPPGMPPTLPDLPPLPTPGIPNDPTLPPPIPPIEPPRPI